MWQNVVHSDFIAVQRPTSADASLSQELRALRRFVCPTRVAAQKNQSSINYRFIVCLLQNNIHIVAGQEKPHMCFWPLNMHFAKIRSCYIRGFALNMFRGQRHIGGFSCPATIQIVVRLAKSQFTKMQFENNRWIIYCQVCSKTCIKNVQTFWLILIVFVIWDTEYNVLNCK